MIVPAPKPGPEPTAFSAKDHASCQRMLLSQLDENRRETPAKPAFERYGSGIGMCRITHSLRVPTVSTHNSGVR